MACQNVSLQFTFGVAPARKWNATHKFSPLLTARRERTAKHEVGCKTRETQLDCDSLENTLTKLSSLRHWTIRLMWRGNIDSSELPKSTTCPAFISSASCIDPSTSKSIHPLTKAMNAKWRFFWREPMNHNTILQRGDVCDVDGPQWDHSKQGQVPPALESGKFYVGTQYCCQIKESKQSWDPKCMVHIRLVQPYCLPAFQLAI